MQSDTTPLRYSRLWDSALEHAEELAAKSGEAAIIYYRPIDDRWFVLRASATAPKGLTIKTTVQPGNSALRHRDFAGRALDGPVLVDAFV